jgi:hypothetical protein
MNKNKNSNDMGEKIDQILERFYKKEIDLLEVRKELLILFSVSTRFSEPELKAGYVKIEGCDNATGFKRICKESELQKVGKEIFAEHPGEDGYYNFTKFLWVNYPDDRPECRLDDLVPYD